MRPGRNGGMLKTGNPGNAGGDGNTPSMMRMRHRAKLNKALDATAVAVEEAEKILRDPKSSRSMRMMAAQVVFKGHDVIGKYSGTASVSLTDNDGNPVSLPAMQVTVTPAPPEETP